MWGKCSRFGCQEAITRSGRLADPHLYFKKGPFAFATPQNSELLHAGVARGLRGGCGCVGPISAGFSTIGRWPWVWGAAYLSAGKEVCPDVEDQRGFRV